MSRAPRGRGSVFEDKARGRWVAQLKVEGKLLRRYAGTQDEAWAARDQLIRDAHNGVTDSRTTMSAFLNGWLRTVEVAPSTLTGYRAKTRLYLIPTLGKHPVAKLQPQHVRELFAWMRERDLAPATIRQTRAILRAALTQAMTDGLVVRNVAALVKPPLLNSVERRPLFPEEARQFLEALRGERLEALYATALLLGLRLGELLGLRWADVQPQERTVQIQQTLQRQGGRYFTGPPKTASSRRALPLPAALVRLYEAHRAAQLGEYMATGARPTHDLVFTSPSGNPINGTWLTHDFQRRLERLGLPKVRFHDMRHSAASLLLAEGFGPGDIMKVLGHSTIAQTMDTYSHVPDETIRAKINRLDEWSAR